MASKISINDNSPYGKLPRLPFELYAQEILGADYELSISSVTEEDMARVNQTYRGKDGPTDILSFPYSDTSGEILLYIPKMKIKAEEFEMDFKDYTAFLFIHGLLHLKGYDHGSTMEQQEREWCERFELKTPPRH